MRVANGDTVKIRQVGDLMCKMGEESRKMTLNGVQHIPNLCVNLLSISQIVRMGFTVIFDKSGVKIYGKDLNDLIASGIDICEKVFVAEKISKNNNELWHRRLGHTSYSTLKRLFDIKQPDTQCIVCAKGKHARSPFNEKGTRATKPLSIIHSDVCGPMTVKSHGNCRYFVTFIDDFTRKVFVYTLKSKGEVFAKFVEFKAKVENETERTIKIFRSDNGTEFLNNNFKEFFAKYGIKHETTAPYSPQQNGLSGRMNRTIIEKVRCMLIDAGLNKQFWAEAVHAAVNVINVLPNASTEKAPDELWHNKKCNLTNFKVFGTKAMVWRPNQHRTKLDPKSYECILLRYADNQKAYRLYDTNTKKIVASRDIIIMQQVKGEITADDENSAEIIRIVDDNDNSSSELNDDNSNNDNSMNDIDETIDAGGNVTNLDESPVHQNNSNDSFSKYRDAVELEDSTVDDGELDTANSDPTYSTRARIEPGATKRVTRSQTEDEDLLIGMHRKRATKL